MTTATPSAFLCQQVSVLENVPLARDTFRLRLDTPEIGQRIRPGQFVMLRLPNGNDPLLGRPFALYDTVLDQHGHVCGIDVVYLVVGKLTGLLAHLRPGDRLDVWGPLGNGFPSLAGVQNAALVAGGIGQTPFLAHIRQLLGTRGYGGRPAQRECQRVRLFYGARSSDLLAGVSDFEAAGADVHLATDDGRAGHHGFVTDVLGQQPLPEAVIGCGPLPMLRVLSRWAQGNGVRCWVSLETPMACGIGICFSCVTPVKTAGGFDYQRVCLDGPVFDAAQLDWNAMAH